MSGRYVSRVLESDLAPDLKFTAVVLASFADDDGCQIRPSMGLVAFLRGLKERRVQYHVEELRVMTILEVVRPATQWHPTHYRMRLDQLPARRPYKPPDRQESLLGPPGVHSTAPPPGVHSTAPGVQPSAPDPSVRSVSTHTYDARARGAENPEVPPAAPLTADPIEAPRLPILVAPTRTTDHDAHAWCGRICVPKFLHRQFKHALGGLVTKRALRMRAFYAETLAAIPAGQPIGEEPLKFWRTAFAARFGGAAPRARGLARPGTRDTYCPHTPGCRSFATCRELLFSEARAERERHTG